MKCSKKRILLLTIAIFIVVIAVTVCSLVFTQLHGKKDKGTAQAYRVKSLKCEGKECANAMQMTEEAPSEKICPTEDCVVAAARMLRWMDRYADPCADFYNYSCGNFGRLYSVPDGWDAYASTDVCDEEIDLQIKSIVEEPIYMNDSTSLSDTKQLYNTCVNLSHIDESSTADLLRTLSSGIGEWPMLQPDWRDCRPDIEWRMAKLNALGLDSLFTLDTEFQGKDGRLRAVMQIAPPLVKDICKQEVKNLTDVLEIASEHRDVLKSVLEQFDVTLTNETDDELDELFYFDFLFCNITQKCREKRIDIFTKKTEDRFTLLKLADISPQINWIRWRNIILSELRLNIPHEKLTIYADDVEECIDDIDTLLLNSTSRVLANYLSWRFVFHHLGFLGKPFRQLLENHHHLMGKSSTPMAVFSNRWMPRWRQCVIYVKKLMPMALLKEYRDAYHDEESDKEMANIVSRVKTEFRIILKDSRDLLENDSIKSYRKIDKIDVEIAYSEKGDKFYNKFYEGLGRMTASFLSNGMKLMRKRMHKLLEGVSKSKTIQDSEFVMRKLFSPFDLRAYNSFRENKIILTLGHLQSYMKPTFPKFKTMSTFGWTVGHELAHGFDLTALDGAMNQNWTWFPSYVLQQAKIKAHCYLESFQYPDTEDAKNTLLNEDLCDSQGMYLAFEAYRTYLSKHGDEDVLPGLLLSNEKLFFISYAQQFCEVHSEELPYVSSGRRTVNQVLKNLPAFSAVYKCPNSVPMNSPKCSAMWT